MPRLYCPLPLSLDESLPLPAAQSRHVQVLRMQPGSELTLFNGEGGEWRAVIEQITRTEVRVRLVQHDDVEREAPIAVHLAVGMPTNERMDWLMEKSAEIGVASIQPLVTSRVILRVAGLRAQRRREHWQAIAASACEQCGRNRVPLVHPPLTVDEWVAQCKSNAKFVLSFAAGATRVSTKMLGSKKSCVLLSGPEGGLDAREEQLAIDKGFAPASLGPRTLRAETAPLAALAVLALS